MRNKSCCHGARWVTWPRLGAWVQSVWLSLLLIGASSPLHCTADIIELKNGIELRGKHANFASMGNDVLSSSGSAGEVDVRLVVVVDDGLRRTFVSKYQISGQREDPEKPRIIRLAQPVADAGQRVGLVGSILSVGPFNDWGTRVCTLMSSKGKINVIQGISNVSPLWTSIEGLKGSHSYVWDMRVATSSIPRDTLSHVLKQHLGEDNPDKRLEIVGFFLQSERYHDAERELKETIRDFPELKNLQQQLTELRQLAAKQLLGEIRNIRDAGQHERVLSFLKSFPSDNVAGETLIQVNEIMQGYQESIDKGQRVQELLAANLEAIRAGPRRQRLIAFQEELSADLGFDTIGRLTDFLNLADDQDVTADEKLTGEQKLALAVSGWLLGSGSSTDNLAVAMSLLEVRRLVQEYLATEPNDITRRKEIMGQLTSLEGANPARVAQLLATLKPPRETPQLQQQIERARQAPGENADTRVDNKDNSSTPFGMLRIEVPRPTGETISYVVQLPPEYHPYRRYPAVVTLNGRGTTPELQIDWWAGSYDAKSQSRRGQATRHGFIVIAPQWSTGSQREYHYTAQEHAAVLVSLRDACKRFSIDTDRVFLSGHAIGGDAAWDIGLAHPDLWAGVIPIVAIANYGEKKSPKYVTLYWENAKHVPLYFVGGSLDERKPTRSSTDLDRYLTHIGYDVMVVEYLGRGHEHFSDEIQRIFEWMKNHRREFFPKSFRVASMRSWDDFFWWVELRDQPERYLVSPFAWPVSGKRALFTESEIRPGNIMLLKTGAGEVTVWFSPEMLDLNQRITLRLNTQKKTIMAQPDVEVLLEDVRTRGDRQHPFWAKQTLRSGARGRRSGVSK